MSAASVATGFLSVPAAIPDGFASRVAWVETQFDRAIPPGLLRGAEIADAADRTAAGGPVSGPDGRRIARTRIGRVAEKPAGTVERLARALVQVWSGRGLCREIDLYPLGFTAEQIAQHGAAAQARAAQLVADRAVQ